ncbi:MAG: DUF2784 domain-containing protein [Actinomycetota bacterium]|jgi:hypothetical protein|nr:DUF2784 domain-containing protein [Actinomycetota bacterium]
MWSVVAMAVAASHTAYLIYQMCGGLLALRDSRWLLPHLAAVCWGVAIVALQGACPVTALEKSLLARAGRAPYSGSFLDHYVFGTYLPNGSQPWVYAAHLAVILLVYGLLACKWRRTRHLRPGQRTARNG